MSWKFLNARETFHQYRSTWDGLNKAQGNHVLLDSMFVGSLIRHFGSEQTLLGITDSNNSAGMVILDKPQRGFWQTFQPSQEPLGLILLADREDVSKQIAELMGSLPGYALGLAVTQQDPDFTLFRGLNPCSTLETLDYITTSRLCLEGNFDEFWKGRGRYYIDDLRRQSRRLDERALQMEFVAERDPSRMSECVSEYGRLEGVGWKGAEGTAVTADNQQGLFYRDILESFSSQGEAVVYRLLFNGKTVASDICLSRSGMLVVLKIAYDENFQGFSPGKFIHREILKSLFTEGNTKVLEWYGRMHDWQTRLGSIARTMFHINFYRHGWVTPVRRYVKNIFSAPIS